MELIDPVPMAIDAELHDELSVQSQLNVPICAELTVMSMSLQPVDKQERLNSLMSAAMRNTESEHDVVPEHLMATLSTVEVDGSVNVVYWHESVAVPQSSSKEDIAECVATSMVAYCREDVAPTMTEHVLSSPDGQRILAPAQSSEQLSDSDVARDASIWWFLHDAPSEHSI